MKKPCAWILPVLQCLQNPMQFVTFPGKIFAKNRKFKKLKKFLTFRFFDFLIFQIFLFFHFSTFRAEISWNVNFSTFRLFALENRDFHSVTVTSQKSTQNWSGPPGPSSSILIHPHPPHPGLPHHCHSSSS